MSNHTDREHALLSMSGSVRWINCEGSVLLEQEIPSKQSSYAAEGQAAHEAIEKACKEFLDVGAVSRESILAWCESVLKCSTEMSHYVTEYVLWLRHVEKSFSKDAVKFNRFLEERVHFTDDVWGTLDYGAAKLTQDGEWKALIVDFKYGKGVEVSAKYNTQLILYGLAFEETHLEYAKVSDFYFVVYQPRTGGHPVSQWLMSGLEEKKNWTKKLLAAERRALEVLQNGYKPGFKVGSWCRFCKAQAVCPAFLKDSREQNLMLLDQADYQPPKVQTLSIPQLITIYKKKKDIEHFLANIEKHLQGLLENGEKVPGYKLVEGTRRRQWGEDVEGIATALYDMGVGEPYQKKLITIGEVERIVGKGKIGNLTCLTKPKIQIVPESDKRTAIDRRSNLDLLDRTESND